jgi:hypothetical protein
MIGEKVLGDLGWHPYSRRRTRRSRGPWRKITEEGVPPQNVRCLVWGCEFRDLPPCMFIATYYEAGATGAAKYKDDPDSPGWAGDGGLWADGPITHWMPLPVGPGRSPAFANLPGVRTPFRLKDEEPSPLEVE